MTTSNAETDVLRSDYQKSVAAYWDNTAPTGSRGATKQDDVNWLLGEVDGLYHHHYGIGDYDRSVLRGPEETRDERIIAELHRLETAQAHFLLDHFGDITPDDRLMDAGSGRGATSFMANNRFGCEVDGVTISEYQVEFANDQAAKRGVSDRVRFHLRNMLDTGFETGSRRAIWTNETTMYVDLFELFAEFSRLLRSAGATSASPAAPTTSWAARRRWPGSTSTTPATSIPAASTSRRWRRTVSCRSPSPTSRR